MSRIKESIKFIIKQLNRSVQRFPITLTVTSVFVVVAIFLSHAQYNATYTDQLERILFALAIGIPFTAAGKLFVERLKLMGVKRILVHAVALALTFLYYFTIPADYNAYFAMRFMALWSILFFLFLITPYFYKREGLSRYVLHLLGRFFLTVLYSGVIYGGISIMIFTIERLFNVNWPNEIYMDLFLVIAGAFGVTHFLGSVPETDRDTEISEYSKIFKSLFLFIILPIVSVYTVILYAYFVKILFNFKLPEGIIGNLVLWYALVSVTTLFFIRDLRSEVSWLNKFYKIYIPLMVVPMGMLFTAIGIRINAYGITMPRYFVVALAVFSTISLIIMWFKKTDTAVVTMTLLVTFIAVTFFGIFSGYSMTISDQTNRLEILLEENGMLSIDGIIIPNSNIPNSQQILITQKLDFMLNAYVADELSFLPKNFDRSRSKEFLGFEMSYYWDDKFNRDNFNYFSNNYNQIISLSGADYMILINYYQNIEKTALDEVFSIKKDNEDANLQVYKDDILYWEIDINKAASEFYLDQTKRIEILSPDGLLKASFEFVMFEGRIIGGVSPQNPEDLDVQSFEVRILMDVK